MAEIPAAVTAELARLRAENAGLLKMLELSSRQAALPGPARAGFFDAPPGPVHKNSPNDAKAAFFGRRRPEHTEAQVLMLAGGAGPSAAAGVMD